MWYAISRCNGSLSHGDEAATKVNRLCFSHSRFALPSLLFTGSLNSSLISLYYLLRRITSDGYKGRVTYSCCLRMEELDRESAPDIHGWSRRRNCFTLLFVLTRRYVSRRRLRFSDVTLLHRRCIYKIFCICLEG